MPAEEADGLVASINADLERFVLDQVAYGFYFESNCIPSASMLSLEAD